MNPQTPFTNQFAREYFKSGGHEGIHIRGCRQLELWWNEDRSALEKARMEIAALVAEKNKLLEELQDWRDSAKEAMKQNSFEVHCSCVPLLVAQIRQLEKQVKTFNQKWQIQLHSNELLREDRDKYKRRFREGRGASTKTS